MNGTPKGVAPAMKKIVVRAAGPLPLASGAEVVLRIPCARAAPPG